jgi:hypothetical protein
MNGGGVQSTGLAAAMPNLSTSSWFDSGANAAISQKRSA